MKTKNIQATFDQAADAVYIRLKRGKAKKTISKGENFLIDFDHKGEVLGFEILQYSKILLAARKKPIVPVR